MPLDNGFSNLLVPFDGIAHAEKIVMQIKMVKTLLFITRILNKCTDKRCCERSAELKNISVYTSQRKATLP